MHRLPHPPRTAAGRAAARATGVTPPAAADPAASR